MSVLPNVISAPMGSSSLVAADVNIALLPGPPLLSVAVPEMTGDTMALEVPGVATTTSVSVCKSLPFLGERAATPQQLNRFGKFFLRPRRPGSTEEFNLMITSY
jgi:hypothetical protein